MKIYAVIGSLQANAMIGNGDISPTLTTAMGMGGGQIPMIVRKVVDMEEYKNIIAKTRQDKTRQDKTCRIIGQMDNTVDHTFESANRVYDSKALCPTIPTSCGGGHTPKVLTKI